MRPAVIGLFEGYGGLTMAIEEVLDGELVAYSEYEPPSKGNPRPTQAATRLLAHRRPGVPNLGDITEIGWSAVEVDDDRPLILTGGFPCQDLSLAGLQAGMRPGTRSGLWSHMAYAIDQLRPDLVVIENVRGLLSAGAACDLEPCPWCVGDDEGRPLRALGAVLGDLADLGYDARWVGLRAADVGAPHGRFRVFVAAWPAADPERDGQPGRDPGGPGEADARGERPRSAAAGRGADVAADAARVGRDEGRTEPARLVGGPDAAVGGDAVQDADRAARGERRGAAPGPAEAGRARPDTGRRGRVPAPDTEDDRRAPLEPGRHGTERSRAPGNHEAAADTDDGAGHGEWARPEPRVGGEAAADSGRDGREGRQERDLGPEAGQQAPRGGDAAGRVLDWGDYGPAIRRWELILDRPAPAPTQTGQRGGQQLSPLFVEWMMGLPEGWVTDPAVGLSRNEQLARLGNGVVPQQAAAALRYLLGVTAVVEPLLGVAS